MTTGRTARLRRLFSTALELDEPARAQFLERACAADDALLREVRELLAIDASVAEAAAPPNAGVVAAALAAAELSIREAHQSSTSRRGGPMEDFDLEYRNGAWHVLWGGERVSTHESWGEALYAAVGRRRRD